MKWTKLIFALAAMEIKMIFDAARIEYKARQLIGRTKKQGEKKHE